MLNLRILICVLLAIGRVSDAYSQTNIPAGNVSGTLALAGSPYLVQGHITVPQNATLTIQPGVTMEFQGHYKLIVKGCLLAVGNANDTIRFRASLTQTSTGWWGIRFEYVLLFQDSSRLAFCKIQMGNATGTGFDAFGGALNFKNSEQVAVTNCLISGNSASEGGAIYCHYSSPLIYKNLIINNSVFGPGAKYGGAIRIGNISAPTIKNNIISNNSSSSEGGGIYTASYDARIYDNLISSNTASIAGGGMFCGVGGTIRGNTITSNSSPLGGGIYIGGSSNHTVVSNIIMSNTASSFGGGIYSKGANIQIKTNTIITNGAMTGAGMTIEGSGGDDTHTISANYVCNNSASGGGGGVYIMFTNAVFVNNVCANNHTGGKGGGILVKGCSPPITNCTIANNRANMGGALFCETAVPKLRNSILFGNVSMSGNGHQVYLFDATSNPPIYYSAVQGGLTGIYANGFSYAGQFYNNTAANPIFMVPSAGAGTVFSGTAANWEIFTISPCVNTGTPQLNGIYLPPTDIAGTTRVIGVAVDMGAFEYNSCPTTTVNTEITQSGKIYIATATGQYQWLDCDKGMAPIPNAKLKGFTPTTDGRYACKITELGCTDTSDCFTLYTVSIDELKKRVGPDIFPSPFTDQLTIDLRTLQNETRIVIRRTDSRIVCERLFRDKSHITLDLEDIPKGMYILSIEMGNETHIRKIVKD